MLAVNVHTANERFDLVRELVVAQSPDVVLLMEVNQRWLDSLTALKGSYPHQLAEPSEDNFGIALFSRIPMTNAAVLFLGLAGVPSMVTDFEVGGQRLHLLGTHPLPPGTAAYAALRNNQFAAIAAHVHGQAVPVIVLGDLNATPGSPFFQDLLRDSGLRNTAPGWNLSGSWPAWLPLGKIPLDHCLVSPSLRVTNRRFGSPVGGDHLPLLVDLAVPPSAH